VLTKGSQTHSPLEGAFGQGDQCQHVIPKDVKVPEDWGQACDVWCINIKQLFFLGWFWLEGRNKLALGKQFHFRLVYPGRTSSPLKKKLRYQFNEFWYPSIKNRNCVVFRRVQSLESQPLCHSFFNRLTNGALQGKLLDAGNVCKELDGVVGSVRGFLNANKWCGSLGVAPLGLWWCYRGGSVVLALFRFRGVCAHSCSMAYRGTNNDLKSMSVNSVYLKEKKKSVCMSWGWKIDGATDLKIFL